MNSNILTSIVSALLATTMFLGVQGSARAQTLSIVHVNAPAVNCKFDPSCKVVVNDFVTDFAWSSTANDSFIQSRTWPQGKLGTAAAELYAYVYRIDLSKSMAATHFTCVKTLTIPFGPVEAVKYSGETPHHVFVVTSGGLGSIAPISAVRNIDNTIDFTFQQPFCNGGQPGKGGMTFFFGLSSKYPSRQDTSTLSRDIGPALSLKSVVPEWHVLGDPPKPKYLKKIQSKN